MEREEEGRIRTRETTEGFACKKGRRGRGAAIGFTQGGPVQGRVMLLSIAYRAGAIRRRFTFVGNITYKPLEIILGEFPLKTCIFLFEPLILFFLIQKISQDIQFCIRKIDKVNQFNYNIFV